MADWEAAMLDAQEVYYPYMDEEGQPWYVSEVPEGWTQGAETTVRLSDLAGKTYTEPTVIDGVAIASEDEDSKLWDSYMNSLTWEEAVHRWRWRQGWPRSVRRYLLAVHPHCCCNLEHRAAGGAGQDVRQPGAACGLVRLARPRHEHSSQPLQRSYL